MQGKHSPIQRRKPTNYTRGDDQTGNCKAVERGGKTACGEQWKLRQMGKTSSQVAGFCKRTSRAGVQSLGLF